MTDLRCSQITHVKAYGDVIEVRCFKCGRARSTATERVRMYHRWHYRDGEWEPFPDRVEPVAGPPKTGRIGGRTMVK